MPRRRKDPGSPPSAVADPVAAATALRKGSMLTAFAEVEQRFRDAMRGPLSRASKIGEADVVIGVPFYNEADTIGGVIETAAKGLKDFYPGAKSVIVAAGSPAGGEALGVIDQLPRHRKVSRIPFLLEDELLEGKGWGILAILELAEKLGADLILLDADLKSETRDGEAQGLTPGWIKLLYEPVKSGEMDMVVSRFHQCHLFDITSSFTYAIFTAIYGYPIRRISGAQWGIHHRLLQSYLGDRHYGRHAEISGFGVDVWLATIGITNHARICETDLGLELRRRSSAKTELVLRQVVEALLAQIVHHADFWEKRGVIGGVPLRQSLPVFGVPQPDRPETPGLNHQPWLVRWQDGFHEFHRLYQRLLSEEAFQQLRALAETEAQDFEFPASLWAQASYRLILSYATSGEFARGDILDALILLHYGLKASHALSSQRLRAALEAVVPETTGRIVSAESERQAEDVAAELIRQKPAFLARWEKKTRSLKPALPSVTYREFVPGVPLVVPTELWRSDGAKVTANGIYEAVFDRNKAEFEQFVYDRLQVARGANSFEVSAAIKDFLRSVERAIFPDADLTSVEGMTPFMQFIFERFTHADGLSLTPETASRLLGRFPPAMLLTKLGFNNLRELLEKYYPKDVLAFTRWTEESEYTKALWGFMAREALPEHFKRSAPKFLIVGRKEFPALTELAGPSVLDNLTGRILVSTLHKGMGGEFPRLRYLLTVVRNLVEAERFGKIWEKFAAQKKDFGRKLINSLEGHWGREPLSAHNIFEAETQSIVAKRIRHMAEDIQRESGDDPDRLALAEHLMAIADSYHLALSLPDGGFATCSAWSWAAYSFQGGRASPAPLSLQVERDWTSRQFLLDYYKAIGGREELMEDRIVDLMAQGREWEDLAPILLGTEKSAEKLVPASTASRRPERPEASALVRFAGNPVLEPIKEHSWESRYVLNAGAVKLQGKAYLVYRAFGEDETSRLGLAVSDDGFTITERLEEPVFEPKGKSDAHGCEDPRLTIIGDRLYMTYVAYDGITAQIALASIAVEDFLEYRWGSWRRHGLVFPRYTDKDATLFPEQFNGKFAMLHRVDPHIWLTFSSHIRCPWSRKEHRILTGATSGMMWDGLKIGAGAQPIKTRYGWLLITHGVNHNLVYRLGVMVLDLADPSKLVYRSPNYILEPSEEWELGGGEKSWKSNVVFTCGAIPVEDSKKVLDMDDELIVYYGAADTVICAATAKVGELIPEGVR